MSGSLRPGWSHPAARLVALIALVTLLFIAALVVAISQFDSSNGSQQRALNETQGQVTAEEMGTALAKEVGLADAYGGDAAAADLRQIALVRGEFAEAAKRLREHLDAHNEAAEATALDAVTAGHRGLERQIRRGG